MPIPSHLFLRRSSLVSLVLRPLLTRTGVSLLAPRVSELSVSTTLDGSWDVALLDLGKGNDGSVGECGLGALGVLLLGGGDLLLRGVSGLGLASLSWEKDEAGAVSLEALNVQGEGLDGKVLAAGVDGDTDGACKLAWDGGLLKIQIRCLVFFNPPFAQQITFSSSREKPRPARTRRLYLTVGQRTIGLSLSTGRGATAAALERRALRRLSLRPGYCVC